MRRLQSGGYGLVGDDLDACPLEGGMPVLEHGAFCKGRHAIEPMLPRFYPAYRVSPIAASARPKRSVLDYQRAERPLDSGVEHDHDAVVLETHVGDVGWRLDHSSLMHNTPNFSRM